MDENGEMRAKLNAMRKWERGSMEDLRATKPVCASTGGLVFPETGASKRMMASNVRAMPVYDGPPYYHVTAAVKPCAKSEDTTDSALPDASVTKSALWSEPTMPIGSDVIIGDRRAILVGRTGAGSYVFVPKLRRLSFPGERGELLRTPDLREIVAAARGPRARKGRSGITSCLGT